jgi:hypothetical protein
LVVRWLLKKVIFLTNNCESSAKIWYNLSITAIRGDKLARGSYNKRWDLEEQMRKLMRLITGNKFSEDKRIKLETQYCYLQRDFKIIESYQKLRNKNQETKRES